jgi:hypothetical protein
MPFFGSRRPPDKPEEPAPPPRVLFLDDDELRAGTFLEAHPEAVWVQTASECIVLLEEAWDEVHLDHDLGGEQFVDSERDDCGMAVVRWIVESPRAHLEKTLVFVHSHNMNAATMMGFHLSMAGHKVEVRPFGTVVESSESAPLELVRPRNLWKAIVQFFRRWPRRDRDVDPEFEWYSQPHRDNCIPPDEPPPERPDFSWLREIPAREPPPPPE